MRRGLGKLSICVPLKVPKIKALVRWVFLTAPWQRAPHPSYGESSCCGIMSSAHLYLRDGGLQVGNVDLGGGVEGGEHVLAPLGEPGQSLVKLLHLRQVGLQLLDPGWV